MRSPSGVRCSRAHHWPHAPNLGDITIIDWTTVPPIDILCGGFPCQDVSTVGKRAGVAPGTRSGLWAHMATAIEALQPEWVVIENVRGLLSAPAIRALPQGDFNEQRNTSTATPTVKPLAIWNPTVGICESQQPDLFGQLAPYSATWWTSGMTRNGSVYAFRHRRTPPSLPSLHSCPTRCFAPLWL